MTTTTETRITQQMGAAYVANSIETEALKTDDPAKTLGDVLDALPEVLPQVFRKMDTDPGLGEALRPEITRRVRYLRDIHTARAAGDDDTREIWDILLGAIRKGSDPGDVVDHLIGLISRENSGASA